MLYTNMQCNPGPNRCLFFDRRLLATEKLTVFLYIYIFFIFFLQRLTFCQRPDTIFFINLTTDTIFLLLLVVKACYLVCILLCVLCSFCQNFGGNQKILSANIKSVLTSLFCGFLLRCTVHSLVGGFEWVENFSEICQHREKKVSAVSSGAPHNHHLHTTCQLLFGSSTCRNTTHWHSLA